MTGLARLALALFAMTGTAAEAQTYYFRERLGALPAVDHAAVDQPATRTCSVQRYRRLGGSTIALGSFRNLAEVNEACSAIPGVTACGLSSTSGVRGFYSTDAVPTLIPSGVDYAAAVCG